MELFKEGNNSAVGKKRKLKDRDFKYEFWKAIKEVEGDKRKTLMKHTVEMAFQNPDILKAVLNKMLPELSSGEVKNQVMNIVIPEVKKIVENPVKLEILKENGTESK